jgi:hypothetical protein
MINPKDPAQLQDAAIAAQAALEEEKQRQSGINAGDAVDIGANVMIDGVGDMVSSAADAVLDGVGTVASTAVDMVSSIIGGIFDA